MCETVLTLRMEEKITKRSAKDMESREKEFFE